MSSPETVIAGVYYEGFPDLSRFRMWNISEFSETKF